MLRSPLQPTWDLTSSPVWSGSQRVKWTSLLLNCSYESFKPRTITKKKKKKHEITRSTKMHVREVWFFLRFGVWIGRNMHQSLIILACGYQLSSLVSALISSYHSLSFSFSAWLNPIATQSHRMKLTIPFTLQL